jgi:hypothetical protein
MRSRNHELVRIVVQARSSLSENHHYHASLIVHNRGIKESRLEVQVKSNLPVVSRYYTYIR